jgi:hypothetical protein
VTSSYDTLRRVPSRSSATIKILFAIVNHLGKNMPNLPNLPKDDLAHLAFWASLARLR